MFPGVARTGDKKKEKKVDYAALNSPFMKLPRMDVATARALLDLGLREVYELVGRAPEALFEDLRKRHPATPQDRLYSLRLAVYCAENPAPDPAKLHPSAWM